MKSLLFGLTMSCLVNLIGATIQYHCYFGDLHTAVTENGELMEFCATKIENPPFLSKGEFLRTEAPDPCLECLCEEDGLSCCECEW